MAIFPRQTTLDGHAEYGAHQFLAMQYGESHPSEIAARWMSYRSVFEQIDPAASSQYNGLCIDRHCAANAGQRTVDQG